MRKRHSLSLIAAGLAAAALAGCASRARSSSTSSTSASSAASSSSAEPEGAPTIAAGRGSADRWASSTQEAEPRPATHGIQKMWMGLHPTFWIEECPTEGRAALRRQCTLKPADGLAP